MSCRARMLSEMGSSIWRRPRGLYADCRVSCLVSHGSSRSARFRPTVRSATSTATGAPSAGRVHSHRAVRVWLWTSAGAVALAVTVGGITRLTKSGLSMTDWKVQGSLPPRSDSEWEAEFNNYKRSPEWNQRKSMTLEEFKYIYWWEYGHRMIGRSLGLVYGLPMLYFVSRGRIPRPLLPQVLGLFALGGLQGLVGWWMVRSGLEVDPNQTKEIRVSPYRLATHLAMAGATFSLLVKTALDMGAYEPPSFVASYNRPPKGLTLATASRLLWLRRFSIFFTSLAMVTAASGAFVAGNDAGHAYNVFPKMTDHTWLPPEILEMQPLWRNFFENTATVQADHRALALSALMSSWLLYGLAWRCKGHMPQRVVICTATTVALAHLQVTLGVTTLLTNVPVPLASAHQVTALALLGSAIATTHSLRFARSAQHLTKLLEPHTAPRMAVPAYKPTGPSYHMPNQRNRTS